MAAPKKTPKSTAKRDTSAPRKNPPITKRNFRLGFGLFFLLTGIFICFAIVSYFFTWQLDQDKLLIAKSTGHFIWNTNTPVANWGGRLGAAIAHLLVFEGAGIASLIIGIWIASLGLNLLYGSRVVPLLKYLRLSCIILLIVAPVLAFIKPHATFPFGGAWGNESVLYLNTLLGKAGTGMLLASVALFFLLVVFSLDFRPFARRAKRQLQTVTKAALAKEDTPKDDIITAAEIPVVTSPQKPLITIPDSPKKEYEISLQEKEPESTFISLHNQNGLKKSPAAAVAEPTPEPEEEDDEDDFFEVIQTPQEAAKKLESGTTIGPSDEPYDPSLELSNYKFPTLDLLEERDEAITRDDEELGKNKNQIIQTLRSFGIEIQRISATVGPTVTLYEIVPAEGVRISKIRNLEDDIALNLAALGIRIIAPIPGKGTIGIEVPNAHKQTVSMRTLLSSEKFINSKMSLPIALGKKIDNEHYIVDLASMPHLLMAGATGQGKSVGINAILVSLLYKKHPSQLKFVMVDPKKVELSIYRTIEKHFLAKLPDEEEAIITDIKKVINTLNALCIEMDNRYEMLKEAGARNIREYNEKFIARKLNPQKGHKYLPFIVLVIDEFADLIMTAGKEVEMPIARLAQLARAVGIHLIIATQRPSVNVITGTIKANFPARMAFKVSAKVDSRTIIDTGGAEQLIGRGDMLVSHGNELLRLQCAFVDTPEVEKVVDFIGSQQGYPSAFELPEYDGPEESGKEKVVDLTTRDDLFEDCARVVVQNQSGSTSMLQRRFNLGYNRAGRIMDQLEAAGIVGPAKGSKPREVLYHTEMDLEIFLNDLN